MPSPPPIICARCHGIACSCRRERRQRFDEHRGNARQRGYDADWERFRSFVLRGRPFCESKHGCRELAAEVHHLVRLTDGGPRLDPRNVQALCALHHRALGGGGGPG